MGCLDDKPPYAKVVGNIHLSGRCNRSCYFCIGQHMMALDSLNSVMQWPLAGLDRFIAECKMYGIYEILVTGSNTDPLLSPNLHRLKGVLAEEFPNLVFGIRTNGIAALSFPDRWRLADKASVTVCSFDEVINRQMMGGPPPPLRDILRLGGPGDVKVNIVLGPENARTGDALDTVWKCGRLGILRVNLREPYGQPHVGDPMAANGYHPVYSTCGMPTYALGRMLVTYWDVHHVRVGSLNLFANGRVSREYSVTLGCSEWGMVRPQEVFSGGRYCTQWRNVQEVT